MSLNHAQVYESCGQYYIYQNSRAHDVEPPNHLELWIPILESMKIDALWFCPSPLSKSISWDDIDRIDRDRNKIFPEKKPSNPEQKPTFISIRRKSDKFEKDFYLAFPENAEWSATNQGKWGHMRSPMGMAQTIYYLEKEMQIDCKWSAGNLGMQILKRHLASKGTFKNTEMTDELRLALNGAVNRPIWKRHDGLTDQQKRMRYIHGFDKNAQYLGAAQSVVLGAGQPKQAYADQFDMGEIGLWHYQLTSVADTEFNGYDLPCILEKPSSLGWNGQGYASSDVLLAARRCGIEFEILDGLVWSKGAKFLESWAREMWQHRVNLRDTIKYPLPIARENAAATAKLAANNMMGRLAHQGNELYKPDWNGLIVQKAIANQFYSLKSWLDKFNARPVLVCTDNFWIASNESDPRQVIPGILNFQNEQRGYKHIGMCFNSDYMIDLFDAESPERINTVLKEGAMSRVESI